MYTVFRLLHNLIILMYYFSYISKYLLIFYSFIFDHYIRLENLLIKVFFFFFSITSWKSLVFYLNNANDRNG